jgi:hypothetical protein
VGIAGTQSASIEGASERADPFLGNVWLARLDPLIDVRVGTPISLTFDIERLYLFEEGTGAALHGPWLSTKAAIAANAALPHRSRPNLVNQSSVRWVSGADEPQWTAR